MRMDRLTSRLQNALADAQSLALGKDHNLIQPAHLLSVLVQDQSSSARDLLAQSGARMEALEPALLDEVERQPPGLIHQKSPEGQPVQQPGCALNLLIEQVQSTL